MKIPFAKYQGTGNDFILVEDLERRFPADRLLIQRQCHRKLGIGADGLILVKPSRQGDFLMQIFNADGGEAKMCGNGLRCLLQFLIDLGKVSKEALIEAGGSVYPTKKEGDLISAQMGTPQVIEEGSLPLDKGAFSFTYVRVGAPHLVCFTSGLKEEEFLEKGKALRHHPRFGEEGVNVNFAEVVDKGYLKLRTYEKGVEGETSSCGTGATSAFYVAWKKGLLLEKGVVEFHSKERLECEIVINNQLSVEVATKGAACHVFSGELMV